MERCRLAYDLGEKAAAQAGLVYLTEALPERLHRMKSARSANRTAAFDAQKYNTDKEILARALRCLGDYVRDTDIVSAQRRL